MKKLLLPLILFAATAAATAADFSAISTPLPVLLNRLDARPPTAAPVESRAPNQDTPADLYWTALYEETFGKGSALFAYNGHKYAIKPLFRKGKYDETKRTYITEPAVQIMDVTNMEKTVKYERWLGLADIVDFPFTSTSGDKLKIKNTENLLSIVSQDGPYEQVLIALKHEELFRIWAENAEKHKRTVHGKTVYLVPQMSRANEGIIQIGFVVSEGAPLVKATGRPLDFVAICHIQKELKFKPVAYSIPLGLKFIYVGDPASEDEREPLHWKIEEMVNEDLYDALDDEALEVSLTTF